LEELIKKEKARLDVTEIAYRNVLNQISVINSNIGNSNMLIDKINSMDFCPLCKQKVAETHKHEIKTNEDAGINRLKSNLVSVQKESDILREAIIKIKVEIESLSQEKEKQEINKLKLKTLNELRLRKESLIKKQQETVNSINSSEETTKALNEKIAYFANLEEEYDKYKIGLEKYDSVLRDLEIKYSSINTRFFDNKDVISMLEKEIIQKNSIKEKIDGMEKIRLWLNDIFIDIIGIMEKKVMSKVYNDFNELFKKWFEIIMGDGGLLISLDNEFNPVIEQNGYNVEYFNLSGGEKTAVALAYRLALNQAINNIVTNIKTNDLIILDEPTDGFSDDQITRIKYVLDELDIKQIIIVSHEPKIESFVNNIIRVRKENHISSVF
jgi:exonuclease SbcC